MGRVAQKRDCLYRLNMKLLEWRLLELQHFGYDDLRLAPRPPTEDLDCIFFFFTVIYFDDGGLADVMKRSSCTARFHDITCNMLGAGHENMT